MNKILTRACITEPAIPQITVMDKRMGHRQLTTRRPVMEQLDFELSFLPLSEAITKFWRIKQAKNLKPKTIKGYQNELRYFSNWLESTYGEISVTQINIDILRQYVVWKKDEKPLYGGHPFKEAHQSGAKGGKASAVNVAVRVLKTFFNELTEDEILPSNPARNLSLMRQEEDTVTPLTDNELRRLLKAPDQKQFAQFRDYVMMNVILDTGIRLEEVCTLENKEVNFETKRLTITALKSKNRKTRYTPFTLQTAKLLKALMTEVDSSFDTTYVFTTNYGTQLDEKSVQKSFSKYRDKARIEAHVSPHVLRHNFATMASHNGMSVFTLQKILGHSDIHTTRKYVQVSVDDMQEQHALYSPITRLTKRI